MIRHLFQTLRLLGISMLAGAAWVAHRPADVSKVLVSNSAKTEELVDNLRQAAIKRAAVIEISEGDINRHLAATLKGKINGKLGGWVEFEGARIDLEPNRARLYMMWKIYGHTRTASVDLAISRDADHFQVELLSGAYGHLQMPRGMMRPIYPSLRALAEALDPEIRALFQMTQITLDKDKLVLDSRFPTA
ncbi:hypothetical protein [Prosthecobacter sp.]|uniref:hypothetical protein n=1 Tax=Prosthecobacter sp. TaxID=1965333 RepID=UPI0037831F8B